MIPSSSFRGLRRKLANASIRRRCLVVEPLDDRIAPATFLVSNLNDDGAGSLRQAILDSNAAAGPDDIAFTGAATSGTIVLLTGELPIADDLTIVGPGMNALSISGNDSSRIFFVDGSTPRTVSISGLALTRGAELNGDGGAIFNHETLTLTQVAIVGNRAVSGGGIANFGGKLTVRECDIFANYASGTVGGGGLRNYSGATAVVFDSVVRGNSAEASGGGIHHAGVSLALSNVTVAGNSAKNAGGIENLATASLANVTVAGNVATQSVGGLRQSGTLNAINTIVSANVAPALSDMSGTVTGGGSNSIFDAGVNLLPLANYGGSLPTQALGAGSSAIDTGAALTTLTAAANAVATTLSVASSTYLHPGQYFRIGGEVVRVDAVPGSTSVTVSRGQKGTTAVPLSNGAAVDLANEARTNSPRKTGSAVDRGAFEVQSVEAPVITSNGGGASATIAVLSGAVSVTTVAAVDPNTPGQTLTLSLGGVDAGFFTLSPSGVLTFASPPNFNAPQDQGGDNTYNVTVTVADNGSPISSKTQDLAIEVVQVVPVYNDASLSVAENAVLGAIVGTHAAAYPVPGETLSYEIVAGNVGNAFSIDGNGQIAVARLALDHEKTPTYSLTIRASVVGKVHLFDTAIVAIAVANADDVNLESVDGVAMNEDSTTTVSLNGIVIDGSAAPKVVSFNISSNPTTNALATTDVAGVIASANWNNVGLSYNGTPFGGVIKDNNGTTYPTVGFQMSGGGPNGEENVSGTSPNAVMMKGQAPRTFIDPPFSASGGTNYYAQVEVTNLAAVFGANSYDVYVYYGVGFSGGFMGGWGDMLASSGEYTDATDDIPSTTILQSVPYTTMRGVNAGVGDRGYTYSDAGYTGTSATGFIRSLGKGNTFQGNYVKFENLNSSTLVITPNGAYINGGYLEWNAASILGLQIVERIPPPAPISITATSNNAAIVPNAVVNYTSPGSSGTLQLNLTANAAGTAQITVTASSNGKTSTVRTFEVVVAKVNDAPTIASLGNLTINEDAGTQTVNLTDLAAGPIETDSVVISALSDNPGLIPHPTVNFSNPSSSGNIQFAPVADQYGAAKISVSVYDGQLTTTREFTVFVDPVNDLPTIDPIGDVELSPSAGVQIVNLAGIGPGPNEAAGAIGSTRRIVSINFNTDASDEMAPTDEAGFVPAANWNNFNDNSGTSLPLVDGSGAPTNVKLTFSGGGAQEQNNAPTSLNAGDNKMMKSGVRSIGPRNYTRGTTQFLLEDLKTPNSQAGLAAAFPFGYDVYVYFGDSNVNFKSGGGVIYESPPADYTAATDTPTFPTGNVTDSKPFNVPDGSVFSGSWIQGANYQVFSNKQVDDVVYSGWMAGAGGSGFEVATFTGLQIASRSVPQVLSVSAASSNPALIPDPVVDYTSPNSTGTLSYTPVAGQFGSAIITVDVFDGFAARQEQFVVNIPAPNNPTKITDIVVDDGSTQRGVIRSMTLSFDANITAVDPGAIVVADPSNAPIPGLTVNVAGVGSSVLTVSFADANPFDSFGPVAHLSLADGLYRLLVDGAKLHSGLNTVDADNNGFGGGIRSLDFHRLYGDYNGDAFIDATDLYPYLVNSIDKGLGEDGFLRTFDFNNDEFVDATDIYPEIVNRIDTGL